MRKPSKSRYSRYIRLRFLGIATALTLAVFSSGHTSANTDVLWTVGTTPVLYADFGESTGTQQQERAIYWTTQSEDYICSVSVYLQKVASPTDSLLMRMYRGGANPTLGTLIATAPAVLGSSLPSTGNTLYTFTFPNCVFLDDTLNYWIRFSRTGSLNDTNKYQIGLSPDVYTYITQYVLTSGSWTVVTGTNIEITGYASGITDTSFFQPPTSGSYGGIDPNSTGVLAYVADLARYLFVPSQGTVNTWSAFRDDLNTRAPFSYFVEIQTIVDTAVASSSAFPAFGLDLTPYGINASPSLFSLTTVRNFIPNNLLALLQNLILYSLWLGFAYHVFTIVRNII